MKVACERKKTIKQDDGQQMNKKETCMVFDLAVLWRDCLQALRGHR